MGEQIEYGDVKVPILRESIAEMYVALQPPKALPYLVAPREAEPEKIVEFFAAHRAEVEGLQAKMRRRFEKSSSQRCTFRTGDIAYVMGRPFMVETCPLGKASRTGKAMRGRVTLKASVNTDISLMKLIVAKEHDHDQARAAFMSYAVPIISQNAATMARVCLERIAPESAPPAVRVRNANSELATFDEGVLRLSEEIVPYPVDCLAYVVWRALMPSATIGNDAAEEALHAILPGWERAAEMLRTRAKPYSNQK